MCCGAVPLLRCCCPQLCWLLRRAPVQTRSAQLPVAVRARFSHASQLPKLHKQLATSLLSYLFSSFPPTAPSCVGPHPCTSAGGVSFAATRWKMPAN
jgi:hypothetical protein